MASTQWPVLFSVITLRTAFYDALNAYAFSVATAEEEKEIKFAYELHTFCQADDIGGRLWEKVQK